jgi:hypothetical protein
MPYFAIGQNAETPRQGLGPLETVRQFYSWYLHRLNQEDHAPIKNESMALWYLTPEFLRLEPSFWEPRDPDVIICSQNVDPAWENNFDVKIFGAHGNRAQVLLALSQGGFQPIHHKVSLTHTPAGWQIDGVDCSRPLGQITY